QGPSARFDVQYSTQPRFGANYVLAPFGPFSTTGQQLKGPCPGIGCGGTMVDPPASREFFICAPIGPGAPASLGLMRAYNNPYRLKAPFKCNLALNKHQGNYGPIGDGVAVDTGFWRVPGMQPENWNEGVRYHTLWGATEWTALYYNDNTSGGAPWSLKWTPFTNLWNYSYYDIQEAGITADRPMP